MQRTRTNDLWWILWLAAALALLALVSRIDMRTPRATGDAPSAQPTAATSWSAR